MLEKHVLSTHDVNKCVGYKNLNKVFAPRVIPMDKQAIIMLRSHARTVKPRQSHVTNGGHSIEKELRGGG